MSLFVVAVEVADPGDRVAEREFRVLVSPNVVRTPIVTIVRPSNVEAVSRSRVGSGQCESLAGVDEIGAAGAGVPQPLCPGEVQAAGRTDQERELAVDDAGRRDRGPELRGRSWRW